jgi:hypothetical protein
MGRGVTTMGSGHGPMDEQLPRLCLSSSIAKVARRVVTSHVGFRTQPGHETAIRESHLATGGDEQPSPLGL